MASNILKLQNFRTNDLVNDSGKQFELGKSWCDDFFKFDKTQSEITINLKFKAIQLSHDEFNNKIIELKLADVSIRGDRKAYANGNNGMSQIKDFFINDLKLVPNINLQDYFAIYKANELEYYLYFVPSLLYNNFLQFFKSALPTVSIINHEKKHLYFKAIDSLQQIYYGAPGTGKSHIVKKHTQGESVVRTTFHPDSDYSTFVGCYKPTTKKVAMRDVTGKIIIENGAQVTEDRIIYEFVEQAFLQAYIKAWKFYADTKENATAQKQYLIIEEINRGNCAQIFGDLFQLLDRNDYGFSDYYIHADKDMQKHLAKAFEGIVIENEQKESINNLYHNGKEDIAAMVLSGEILLLPNNLFIWATMNTSDQSLFPIDSAFKRRWEWKYRPIVKGIDKDGNELNWRIAANGNEYDWWSFLEKINAIIGSTTNSEDKKLGFFFCKAIDGIISAETFVGKVIFYLWNDIFKNFGFDNSIFKDEDNSTLEFDKFYTTDSNGETIVQKTKIEILLNNLNVDVTTIDDTKSKGKFSLNGKVNMSLGDIAKEVVESFALKNPEMSAKNIRDFFVEQCKGIGVAHIVETEDEYHQRDGQFSQARSASMLTTQNGEKLYVTTQWRSKKADDNFIKFIKIVHDNNLGTITQIQ